MIFIYFYENFIFIFNYIYKTVNGSSILLAKYFLIKLFLFVIFIHKKI